MLDIPMNLNNLNSTKTSVNIAGGRSSLTDTSQSFIDVCLGNTANLNNTDILNNTDVLNNTEGDNLLESILNSLDSFTKDLVDKDEDFQLNEDISFLQAIMPLLENMEVLSKNIGDNPSPINLEGFNTENLQLNNSLAVELFSKLDGEFLEEFKELETLELKKSALSSTLGELIDDVSIQEDNSSFDINGFYNNLKTYSEVFGESSSDSSETSFESLDSIDMIELLSADIKQSKNIENSQVAKSSDSNMFLLHQDTLPEDLGSTLISMKNTNLRQLKLKLSPKEFGDMTIDISQLDNVSKIVLTVSNQDTLNIIKSNLKDIIEHLKESGLISSETSVMVQSDGSNKESFSSFNGFSSNENSRNNNGNLDDDLTDVDSTLDITHAPVNNNSRALNILA